MGDTLSAVIALPPESASVEPRAASSLRPRSATSEPLWAQVLLVLGARLDEMTTGAYERIAVPTARQKLVHVFPDMGVQWHRLYAIALACGMGWASWHLLEKHFVLLGRQWYERLKTPARA